MDSSKNCPGSNVVHQGGLIEINNQNDIYAVAFLDDGKHIVSGGSERKIQRWRVQDGRKVGTPIDARDAVCNVAVSRDGKWVMSGTISGEVTIWNAKSDEKVIAFKGHEQAVDAMEVSPDGTRIATGSRDETACVWSLPTAQQLLGPWKHENILAAVSFSPDGRLIATATWMRNSIRLYDSLDGYLHVDFSIKVKSLQNQSVVWTSDSKQLYALALDGNIYCLDASTCAGRANWAIHSNYEPMCIALAGNGTFIAASANSSISFWDTVTHKQIGSVIHHTALIESMAISINYDLALGGGRTISLRSLFDILPLSYFVDVFIQRSKCVEAEKTDLEKTVESLRAQVESSNSQNVHLEEINQRLHNQLCDSRRAAAQEKVSMNETVESLHGKIAHLEQQHAHSEQKVDSLLQIVRAYEQKCQCEAFYSEGRIIDAAVSFLEMTNTLTEEVRSNRLIADWLARFTSQCISTLEIIGDEASTTGRRDDAVIAYSTALSLDCSAPDTLLTKWASKVLAHSSVDEALTAAAKFKLPNIAIYRVICDVLELDGRVLEAIKCFQRLQNERGDHMSHHNGTDSSRKPIGIFNKRTIDETEWFASFKLRYAKLLEQHGDVAMESASYKDAAAHYSTALALDPLSVDLLTKRSKALAKMGSWKDSLQDADAAIKLDPSSPHGYEVKHAALLGARCYDEAINAYSDMLLKLERSPDPVTRELRHRYVSPSKTIAAIRKRIERTQRDAPLAVINTETGLLRDKRERLEAFEADPTFKQLVASMTTALDHSRITQTVQEYFRYATFSHTWEGAEPLFHDVLSQSAHGLAASSTTLKLVMFCATAREAGLRWAWSDTCCINKVDGSILQESLTSMFQWYHESALTIVHLKGVLSNSELGALVRCLWNTRAWTLQEFFASRVIRFYTEDWKPYFPDETTYNHKDSSAIMAEMATANGVDVRVLLSLRPGSEDVRQKLCLAATRTATKQEDIAYSLFGIFDVSIPVSYGEGEQRALGRLLQEVLTRSGDVTILGWTGKASDYNSCLPAEIGVYREPATPYIPPLIEEGQMEGLVAELQTSSYLDSAMALYDRVVALPSPRLVSRRLSLSCITFQLKGQIVSSHERQGVYHGMTSALGNVEIRTTEDLYGMTNLVLVHPWLKCLLDPALRFHNPVVDEDAEPLTPLDEDGGDGGSTAHSPFFSHTVPPSHDKLTRALRLFARLRQPFGALLLAPLSHNEYQRIASDQPIVVQLRKNVSPRYLVTKMQTLDIL